MSESQAIKTRPVRRIASIALVLSTAIIFLVVALFKLPEWRHNAALREFTGRVLAIDRPPDAYVESHVSEVGLLGGNGNHCDYQVRLTVVTTGPLSRLVEYYGGVSVRGIENGEIRPYVYLPADNDPQYPQTAIVEFEDPGYSAGLDMRCN